MLSPSQPLRIFLLGVVGSIAVEVWNIHAAYESGRQLPARYKKKGFWTARGFLAVIGGVLASAYNIQSDLLAFHIGASAPALIGTFARQSPPIPGNSGS